MSVWIRDESEGIARNNCIIKPIYKSHCYLHSSHEFQVVSKVLWFENKLKAIPLGNVEMALNIITEILTLCPPMIQTTETGLCA